MKEIIIAVIASSAGIIIAVKGIIDVVQKKKEVKKKQKIAALEINNGKAINNELLIHKIIEWLRKEYNCNRVMLLGLHNSGQFLTPLSKKKISIFDEVTSDKTIKELDVFWQSREVDHEILRFADYLNKDEYLHYENITDQFEDNKGVRSIFNAKQGHEMYFVKVGWFGNDKLMFIALQRDFNSIQNNLVMHNKAIINYKASEIKTLLKDTINL